MKERKIIVIKVLGAFGKMKIVKIIVGESWDEMPTSVCCIGYFDGLHLGHQKLFDEGKKIAKARNEKLACICFDNDPWIVLHKSKDVSQLTPYRLRMKKLEELGVEICYLLHFNKEMMKLSVDDFLHSILEKLKISTLLCGKDFHYAHHGTGDVEYLKNGSFDLEVVSNVLYEQEKISSSKIEKLLKNGEIQSANLQLGYIYTLSGNVIHGKGVGKTKLGFPTANLLLDDDYVIPKRGVYAGIVYIQKEAHWAMINVGHNPTMNHKEEISIEAHILAFERDIYGEKISISFIKMLREEQRFESINALIQQLKKDIQTLQKIKDSDENAFRSI